MPLLNLFAPAPPPALLPLRQLQNLMGGNLLLRLLKLTQIDELYSRNAALPDLEFVSALLQQLGISYSVDPAELKNIPATGAFIAVANHPYGALDGLLLLELLKKRRPEAKVMANDLLSAVPNLAPAFLAVDPFGNKSSKNMTGLRKALLHLEDGLPLGIFPAGEVSTWQLETQKIVDRPWQATIGKLIQKAGVPVVPIYFSGHNSITFQLMSLVHSKLQTARLPAELLNKQGHHVQVRIGKPIQPNAWQKLPKAGMLPFLRTKTYALAAKPSFQNPLEQPGTAIATETDTHLLAQELAQLPPDRKLLSHLQFDVYLARPGQIPHALREIGRLREITFRQVGEGTQQALDLDQYDHHYQHLFLYDRETKLIVGAYRIGKGHEIWKKHGKKGFYLHSLFKIKNELSPLLKSSLELGRSFIRKEYQGKNLPLLLLWKGLSVYVQQRPRYQYLIGPVSISSCFSKLSQSLMVQFIKDNFYDHGLAQYVKPRKAFKVKFQADEQQLLLQQHTREIFSLDALIKEIEPHQIGVPPLLKRYLMQNARIIGFNIDPAFSYSLDGFMVMQVTDLPAETKDLLRRVDN